MNGGGSDRPVLHVVSGSPSTQELAAVVTVLASGVAPAAASVPQWSLWARKSRQVRPALRPGPGAWRASMMPR